MRNSFGNNLTMTVFGESHGPCIGVTLDGLPSGFQIDFDSLEADMEKRKAYGALSTQRHEEDKPEIVSGLYNGRTTGTPLTLLIANKDTRSKDYEKLRGRLRPGHADYSAHLRYNSWQDFRGGGHFSGRLTAALVAAGNICKQILQAHGVQIGSHLEQIYTVHDRKFSDDPVVLKEQIEKVNNMRFAVLDEKAGQEMEKVIMQAQQEGDSVGGIIETAVLNFPGGIGDPIFDTIEGELAHILYGVPAVKGISFGAGFSFARMKGSEANDALCIREGIQTRTNNNAGINGGISNGMPILIHTCIKPTPSIYKEQDSVDYMKKEEVKLVIQGRHDPCIVHRARIVIDNMIAFGLLDCWMTGEALRPFSEAPYEG